MRSHSQPSSGGLRCAPTLRLPRYALRHPHFRPSPIHGVHETIATRHASADILTRESEYPSLGNHNHPANGTRSAAPLVAPANSRRQHPSHRAPRKACDASRLGGGARVRTARLTAWQMAPAYSTRGRCIIIHSSVGLAICREHEPTCLMLLRTTIIDCTARFTESVPC